MFKKTIALFFAILLTFQTVCVTVLAYTSEQHNLQTAYGIKNNDNVVGSYFSKWKNATTEYLIPNSDGGVSAVQFSNGQITVETYNKEHVLVSNMNIPLELSSFGCFYSGTKYNYIAFGENNAAKDDNKEVIRVVRYDKDFKRIDAVSVRNCLTVSPFEAGCGRMSENGNKLVLHTSRLRYDGHQSQLTLFIDTSTMNIENADNLGAFQANHVSHSFDQYVLFDGDFPVFVDHGDAFPRSVYLQKRDDSVKVHYTGVNLFGIPGSIGANCTGVSVSGFELTPANYIVALSSIDHSVVKEYTSSTIVGLTLDQRDIVLCIVPKDNLKDSEVKQKTIARYVGTSLIASIPKLVKIHDNKFMILWQEFKASDRQIGSLKYVFVDQNGNMIGNIETLSNYELSDVNPIVVGDDVVWYTNKGETRKFYAINYKLPQSISIDDFGQKKIGDADFNIKINPDALSGLSKYMYLSTNSSVATIDSTGKVTICKPGVTDIYVMEPGNDDYKKAIAMRRLTVK